MDMKRWIGLMVLALATVGYGQREMNPRERRQAEKAEKVKTEAYAKALADAENAETESQFTGVIRRMLITGKEPAAVRQRLRSKIKSNPEWSQLPVLNAIALLQEKAPNAKTKEQIQAMIDAVEIEHEGERKQWRNSATDTLLSVTGASIEEKDALVIKAIEVDKVISPATWGKYAGALRRKGMLSEAADAAEKGILQIPATQLATTPLPHLKLLWSEFIRTAPGVERRIKVLDHLSLTPVTDENKEWLAELWSTRLLLKPVDAASAPDAPAVVVSPVVQSGPIDTSTLQGIYTLKGPRPAQRYTYLGVRWDEIARLIPDDAKTALTQAGRWAEDYDRATAWSTP